MSEVVLRLDSISKQYRKGIPSGNDRVTELLANLASSVWHAPSALARSRASLGGQAVEEGGRSNGFWALRDVSFEVRQGQGVAIVGRNGAGKSTLLKVVSRVTQPTSGSFRMRGRVSTLLEAGAGFHGELTGRENIFLGGALLGVSRRVIARRLDEIVDYSGIGSFLDTPVKRYSSGMYTRLAFSVAIFMDLDILIVDEILSVGDSEFQQRAIASLRDQLRQGKTLLYVSHDARHLRVLCDRFVKLDTGRVVAEGQIAELPRSSPGESESPEASDGENRAELTSPTQIAVGKASRSDAAVSSVTAPCLEINMPIIATECWEKGLIVQTQLKAAAGKVIAHAEIWPTHAFGSDRRPLSRRVSLRCQGLEPGCYTASFSFRSADGRIVAPNLHGEFMVEATGRCADDICRKLGIELSIADESRLAIVDD